MSIIQKNILVIKESLPQGVELIAVSKTKPETDILEAYNAGQLVFGENKALEMRDKYANLPKDIQWHFIGHLQSNKIKYIAPFVSLIHSVDSLKLLQEINKEAIKNNRIINCLLQFYIAKEDTKFGLDEAEASTLLESDEFNLLKNIQICGVMGMATFTDNQMQIRDEFRHLKAIFNNLKQTFFINNSSFQHISMGMTDDYKIAIEEGSTLVRIGSAIFGNRIYNH